LWKKKNYRKIPHNVLDRLTSIDVDDLVVACVKRLTLQDVAKYAHLNIRAEEGHLVVPPPTIPPARMGKYSAANVQGREIVRRDLPKVSKSFTVEVPNWHGSGTHDIDYTRQVYLRDLIPPKEVALSVEVLSEEAESTFLVKFAIDQVLNRGAPDFEGELLYNLNILQENVGAIGLFTSTATIAEYIRTIHVEWEILPPGTVDEVLRSMLQGKRPVSDEQRRQMKERLTVLERLGPECYIAGTSEFLRYFGAKFGDNFVAFENLTYGNALYVMYENWKQLSQRSRIDLLKGPREGFERIPHASQWAKRLEVLLERYRKAH
jgi:hypothetical protein